MTHPIVNIDALEFVSLAALSAAAGRSAPPERFGARIARIAPHIGARALGYNLTVIAPGCCAFPFHSHRANEEMFFVLDGSGEIRIGDTVHPIRAGDVIACPAGGPETAHQIRNTSSDAELRVLAVSTQIAPELCEYPDSGKFMVSHPESGDAHLRFRYVGRPEQTLDYWDGE